MIHIYCGDGKGKTTAACGLAARAAGSGKTVLFTQFFKDGSSSEIRSLSLIPGIDISHPSLHYGMYRFMTDSQKAEIKENYTLHLKWVISSAEKYDLIVLDEAVSAYRYDVIPREELIAFLKKEGQAREIVMTGRNPAEELIAAADYVTEMKKIKHPFDRGIAAREGIEF